MPHRPYHKKWGIIAGVAVVAICASFLIAAVSTKTHRNNLDATLASQHHTDLVLCQRMNKLYRQIQKQVRTALVSTPKIEYYKNPRHAQDLQSVMDNLNQELVDFAPQPCPKEG